MNLNDVINYILSTENVEDIPAIMDAITERVATEMGVVAEPVEEAAEIAAEDIGTETAAPEENTMSNENIDLSQFAL